jgi:F-type H+-transporting ATPase subunit b
MSQEVELTTEQPLEGHVAPAQSGVAASLGLNGQLFAFQLFNFALVAVILWFLILKPLTKKMEERKKIIDESLDKAKEVETNLAMSEQNYKAKLEEAKSEANKIIEKAHGEAEQLGNEMKAKTKTDIEQLVVQAKKQIVQEKETMMEGIKQETASLVVMAVEKILNEKVDLIKDKKLIEDSLKGLKS